MKALKKIFLPIKLLIVLVVVMIIWILIGIIDLIFNKETIEVDEVRIKI